MFYNNEAHEGDKLTTWPLHDTVKGKIVIVDMREIYQRLLLESRAQRESSRLDIGSRLGLARRETEAERGGRRHRQRPRKRTAKTAGLEGGEVGEGKPVSWNSLGVRGEKSQEASVDSKRRDAVGAWRPAHTWHANRHHESRLSLLPVMREKKPLVEGNHFHKFLWNANFCLTATI